MRRARPAPAAPADAHLVIYGHHAVLAALGNPERPCHRLVATTNALERLGGAEARPELRVESRAPRELDRLVPAGAVHQGLVLEAGPLPERSLADLMPPAGAPSLLLALDQIEDPRNLGAILRSAAALGVGGVLLPRHGSAMLAGPCAKAASGALDLVPVAAIANLAQALDRLKEAGHWVIGLDGTADQALEALEPYPRRVLVLGAEGRGLRRLTSERCDLLARLTIEPRIESLNVSVAAGIALYLLAHDRPRP
jgi:23S rRNA (guanosine2251-2'-O)-methyltransferase